MAYTPIDKSSDYFNTVLYTGTGADNRAVTGVGFQPDWLWIKDRSSSFSHALFDVVRGSSKMLATQGNDAEQTNPGSGGLTSFDTDGFTTDAGSGGNPYRNTNQNNDKYVSWNWLGANGTASNSNGSITSTVSANTTSGFSIVKYTGNATNATIGHGLGVVPKMIIVKDLNQNDNWNCYHVSIGNNSHIHLNLTNAASGSSSYWQDTNPTSSVFSIGSLNDVNYSGHDFVAYCLADVKGYSKFGSYTGNGSTDGTFVYTGFKPAYVMIKRTDGSADWHIQDDKRNTFNAVDTSLFANTTDTDTTSSSYATDFLSNGFKLRGTTTARNGSGSTYLYMAFAENPFVTSTGIPTPAR